MDENVTIKTYNQKAEEFAEFFNSFGARKYNVKNAFSYINKFNPRVLELGCGNGRDVREILKYTNNYIGVDLSKELIKIAKKDYPDCIFLKKDIIKYTFPKNLDIIFAFASLLHLNIKQVEKVFYKVSKSLNEDGIFFISTKYGEYKERLVKDDFGERVFYYYNLETLKPFIKDFEIIDCNVKTRKGNKWLELIVRKVSNE